jgi:hypothetical protein
MLRNKKFVCTDGTSHLKQPTLRKEIPCVQRHTPYGGGGAAMVWEQTNFTEPSPSWEAANCAATQELPSILWNPEVHYPFHKSPFTGPYPEPDQCSPYHPILSKIHFNIIHPPTSWSSGFPTNILYAFLFFPFVLHALPISSSLTWPF